MEQRQAQGRDPGPRSCEHPLGANGGPAVFQGTGGGWAMHLTTVYQQNDKLRRLIIFVSFSRCTQLTRPPATKNVAIDLYVFAI